MHGRDAESTSQVDAAPASEVAGQRAAGAFPGTLTAAARSGRLAPRDLLRLQRTVGNRAVGRIAAAPQRRLIQRAPEEKRRMVEGAEGGKTDEAWVGPGGDRFVWDPFDRTLTIFTPVEGPGKGQAFRFTYKEGTPEELAKLPAKELFTNQEILSPIRAKALEWLRTEQGTFQETEEGRGSRVVKVKAAGDAARERWAELDPKTRPKAEPKDARTTLCNLHTGDFATAISGASSFMNMMDPRDAAVRGKRPGAFHTLDSHPAGPQAGDIVSYGAVSKPPKNGGLRSANFLTTMHVGVFKSRRPGPNGTEIWTVVDGGQGTFESRQETRERTRIFQKERLKVSIPKLSKSGKLTGWERDAVEMECGVLSSKLADAGQSDEDKLLRGWVDIDEFFGAGDAPAPTAAGASNPVFAGNPAAVPAGAAP